MVRANIDMMYTTDYENGEITQLNMATNALRRWNTGFINIHGISRRGSLLWTAVRSEPSKLSTDGRVLRLDTAKNELTVFALPGPFESKHSRMDSKGRLWIAGGDLGAHGAALFALDTATLVYTTYLLPDAFNPWAIQEDADGSIWFSNFSTTLKSGESAVGRLDPATGVWTTYPGYPIAVHGTGLTFKGSNVLGTNIGGEEFYFLNRSGAATKKVTLARRTSPAVVLSTRTVSPVTSSATVTVTKMTSLHLTTQGVTSGAYTRYSVPPTPALRSNLFGMVRCGSDVWMTGLYADRLYHFTL